MRTGPAVALGVLAGVALAAVLAAMLGIGRSRGWSAVEGTTGAMVSAASPDRAVSTAVNLVAVPPAPVAVPTRPAYGPPVADPPAVYRCRSEGRTSYANTPCVGGEIVGTTAAASGFDSRPSDRLARLVEAGRAPVPDASRPRVATGAQPVPVASASVWSGCDAMRQQIADIDRFLCGHTIASPRTRAGAIGRTSARRWRASIVEFRRGTGECVSCRCRSPDAPTTRWFGVRQRGSARLTTLEASRRIRKGAAIEGDCSW